MSRGYLLGLSRESKTYINEGKGGVFYAKLIVSRSKSITDYGVQGDALSLYMNKAPFYQEYILGREGEYPTPL